MKRKVLLAILTVCLLCSIAVLGACGSSTQVNIKFYNGSEVYREINTDTETAISLPENPVKSGFSFGGWYLDAEYNVPFTISYVSTLKQQTNLKVYAKWIENGQSDSGIVYVTGISLTQSSVSLFEGEKVLVGAKVSPINATYTKVNWSSSNTAVATVDRGIITAVGKGIASITATTADGNKTATCSVTVGKHVSDVTLSDESITLNINAGYQLIANVRPADALVQGLIWSSSNEAVATVINGYVSGISAGTSVITVMSKDGGKVDTCTITVNASAVSGSNIPVEAVYLDKDIVSVTTGEYVQLNATVLPRSATNKNVVWESDDETTAIVVNGKVTGLKAGVATITVSTLDGNKIDECVITVSDPTPKVVYVTSVELNVATSGNMEVGDTLNLTATVLPSNADDKSVVWVSSDSSIAKVSENGVVTAVGGGTAVITVATVDGFKTASCTVTVIPAVEAVTLDITSITLNLNETETLTATVTPFKATDKSVTWSSTDSSIVSVDGGVITALKQGQATITVTTNDGGKTAQCVVSVVKKVTGITLSKNAVTLLVNGTDTLVASIIPADATNLNYTWESNDTSVVTVSNGIITAVSTGTATITATTEDGQKTANCIVNVVAPLTALSDSQITVQSGYTKYEIGSPITKGNTGQVLTTTGFGAQMDTDIFLPSNNMSKDEKALWKQRIKDMNLQYTRIKMFPEYFERANDNADPLTWNSNALSVDFYCDEMLALYEILDICEEEGINVDLSWYGCYNWFESADGLYSGTWLGYTGPAYTSSWVTGPMINMYEEYAENVSVCLDFLLNEKGYTCIYGFSVIAEMFIDASNTVNYGEFANCCRVVKTRLQNDGLFNRLKFIGTSNKTNVSWNNGFYAEQQQVADVHNVMGIGCYNWNTENMTTGVGGAQAGLDMKTYFNELSSLAYNTFNWDGFVISEFCQGGHFTDAVNKDDIDDYNTGMYAARLMAVATSAGVTAIDHYILGDTWFGTYTHTMGLWMYRDSNERLDINGTNLGYVKWAAHPEYYFWAMVCKYTDVGSQVYRLDTGNYDVLMIAFKLPDGSWSYYIINSTATPYKAAIVNKGADRARTLNCYKLTESSIPDNRDCVLPEAYATVDNTGGVAHVTAPANGMLVVSSKGLVNI